MTRVEIIENRLSDTDAATERHYLHEKGDVVTIPDDLAARWCGLGWAKSLDGSFATGERIPGAREPMQVQKAKVVRPAPRKSGRR